ncbi:MAG: single-stranded-DNA-specific exonuclease RecJ [Clostridiales Family XIII bacterium]|jgi:single-stranded-DNA-specific exonuclease|nr:single-stranded-DNA-specific exonuclease RecJ [Clostridiales Family XIII bacterium]
MTKKRHPVVCEILKQRGITEPEDIEEFLSEKPARTYDPFLLRNMEEGVDFLLSAVKRDKRICIYGDYDVDGVTSAALLVQTLRHLTDRVSWYIPSRFDEGYGLNKEAIQNILNEGGQVVVTVDCGSVSAEEVAFAQASGLEILVTDHHNIEGRAADCLIINPKQAGERYPFAGLSGCGVAFKLAQALQRKTDMPKRVLQDLLDLVGLATIADIVPLVDENRTIVKYGLHALNAAKRPGIRALAEKAGLAGREIESDTVAYVLAPHINAAGRMGEAKDVVEMLLSHDEAAIDRIADVLVSQNTLRKKTQEETFAFCAGLVEERFAEDPICVINAGTAHEGITGIVAGKLKDKYGRPVLILTESHDVDGKTVLKGTGRSIAGVDLYKLLEKYGLFFEKFGGHAMACGFSLYAERESAFRQGLIADLHEMIAKQPDLLASATHADLSLRPDDITIELAKQLNTLAPFGNGNPAPLFALHGQRPEYVVFMGETEQHARFRAGGLSCVLFRTAQEHGEALQGGCAVTLVGRPSLDRWNGRERVQFIVETIEPERGENGCLS